MKLTKDGTVLWKDIEKMMGGQKIRASNIDLNSFRKLPSLGPHPTDNEEANEEEELLNNLGDGLNKMDYIMEQIKTNKVLREKLDRRIKTWNLAVKTNKELDNKLKQRAITTMDEGFVRQAKAKLETEEID